MEYKNNNGMGVQHLFPGEGVQLIFSQLPILVNDTVYQSLISIIND